MNTQQEAKEMKECPFCGGTPELITRGNDYGKSRSAEIVCKPCGVKVIVAAIRNNSEWCQSKVLEKWNNRTGQSTHPIAADAEAVDILKNKVFNAFIAGYANPQLEADELLAFFEDWFSKNKNAFDGYASQPKGAGVWVKASERMPNADGRYFAKCEDGTNYILLIKGLNKVDYRNCVEWLDESSSLPSQEGQQTK